MSNQQPATSSTNKSNKGKAFNANNQKTQSTFAPGLTSHPALKLSTTIEKLKAPGPESNYLDWSWVLDMHFNTTGVGYIINLAIPNPYESPSFAYDNGTFCSVIAQTIESANILFIQHLNRDGKALWQGLHAAHQDSSSGGVMYWMRKLFLSHHQGDDIKSHLETMENIFERLNALTNLELPPTQVNFYTTAIFTPLSQDWLLCLCVNEQAVCCIEQGHCRTKTRRSPSEGLCGGHQAHQLILCKDQVLISARQSRGGTQTLHIL
jgi:hypothetical protein